MHKDMLYGIVIGMDIDSSNFREGVFNDGKRIWQKEKNMAH